MPVYQYQCDNCGARFEVRQSFHDEPFAVCSICRGTGRRVFCPVPIVFKGPGFYVTDYRKDNNGSNSGTRPSMEGAGKVSGD